MLPLRRRLIAAVTLTLVAALLVPLTEAPAAARFGTFADQAGFSPGAQILWLTDAQLATDLDAMAATGARYVRIDFDWGGIEPVRGTYRWTNTDRVVQAALQRGLEVIALPTYTPAWARPAGTTDKHAPLNSADFANFARAAAQRYAPQGVTVWEIWNEPNIVNFWQPRPDAHAYTRLLTQASAAIRSVAPQATILSAGLSPAVDNGTNISPYTFIDILYANGARHSFDGVAIHPYSFPALPTGGESWNTLSNVPRIHQTMVRNGDGHKLIWGTEFGAPTGSASNAVSEQRQAQILAQAYEAWDNWSFTGPLLWYSNRDAGTNPADVEHNFGLLRRNGSPKLASPVFADTMQLPSYTTVQEPPPAPTPPEVTPDPTPDPTPPEVSPDPEQPNPGRWGRDGGQKEKGRWWR
jgi:polysaccharide biosynthesis protein PslG